MYVMLRLKRLLWAWSESEACTVAQAWTVALCAVLAMAAVALGCGSRALVLQESGLRELESQSAAE